MKKLIIAFMLLSILLLLSSCSETIQTISPTVEPSETETPEIVETKTPLESEVPETTPTPTPTVEPTPSLTPTPTAEPTPTKKEKITKDEAYSLWKYVGMYDGGGLSYEKAVEILGVEGYYIDECMVPEYQWDVDTGEYVYFLCVAEKENGKEVRYIVPSSRDFENYSVKDTPDFFRIYDPVSLEDCEKIKKGMTYGEIREILGESNFKEEIPSGYTLVEWVVDDGRYFFCQFSGWLQNLDNTDEVVVIHFSDFTIKTRREVEKILAEQQ